MKNKLTILKIIICFLVVMIIVISVIGLIFIKTGLIKDNIIQKDVPYTEENEDMYDEDSIINMSKYYAIKTAINKYMQLMNKNNSSYFNRDGVREVTDESIQKEIFDLLSDSYITDNKITVDNVFNFVDIGEKKVVYILLDIQYIGKNENVSTFFTDGVIIADNNELLSESYFIVNLDMINSTFSVEPTTKDKTHKICNDSSIEKNDNNIYRLKAIKGDTLAQEYANAYKNVVTKAPQLIYKKFDETYATKRFGSQEKFEQYVNANKDELEKIVFSKYLVNTYVDYTEYVCQDQYGGLYIFKVKQDISDYTIELDDYTLPDEELDKQYMNLSTQAKVVNNINKWIKMLNNRDYAAAFNVLDEAFRTQNFDNDVDKFEQYMREHFPEHYDFEQIEYSEESGISVQTLTLKNITGGTLDEEIEETIYMQIGEGTDFVMSFNVI